jgi:hypothetical protein
MDLTKTATNGAASVVIETAVEFTWTSLSMMKTRIYRMFHAIQLFVLSQLAMKEVLCVLSISEHLRLFGRGGFSNQHAGNIIFLQEVMQLQELA